MDTLSHNARLLRLSYRKPHDRTGVSGAERGAVFPALSIFPPVCLFVFRSLHLLLLCIGSLPHFSFSLRLMRPLGNVVNVHRSARVITLSLSLCPSPALSHTFTAEMKMLTEQPGSSWLQASAGSASEEEKQRETHRKSPVTNYFISTNIPCNL